MPSPSGPHFTSGNLLDCEFCPPAGRRFRTIRQCSGCGKALCLVCRPEVPGTPFLCPDCGGEPPADAIRRPAAAVERIRAAGHTVPFWLTVLHERSLTVTVETEELIVPE
jgi:hypothetical protein